MTKEERVIYNKAYNEANKEAIKTCRDANKESRAVYDKILNNSEGVGVYKATYDSGIYIGSGQLYGRRTKHLNGSSDIAKALKEKATSFEVICLTDTAKDAKVKEQKVIDWYGLPTLLNITDVKGV